MLVTTVTKFSKEECLLVPDAVDTVHSSVRVIPGAVEFLTNTELPVIQQIPYISLNYPSKHLLSWLALSHLHIYRRVRAGFRSYKQFHK